MSVKHSFFLFGVTVLFLSIGALSCAKPQSKKSSRTQEPVVTISKRSDSGSSWLRDPVLIELCGAENLQVENPKNPGVTPLDQRVMCTVCPKVESDLGPAGEAHVLAYIHGAFTGANRNEALVTLSGCEAHYLNFGGTFLLEQTSKGWLKKSYYQGWVPEVCKSDSGVLICESGSMGMGESLSTLEKVTFSKTGERKSAVLATYGSNLGVGFLPKRRLYSIENLGWELMRIPGKGPRPSRVELVAGFEIREGFFPESESSEVIDQPESFLQTDEINEFKWKLAERRNFVELVPDAFTRAGVKHFASVIKETAP